MWLNVVRPERVNDCETIYINIIIMNVLIYIVYKLVFNTID